MSQNINKALASGVGGLQYTAQSPPGLGRLIRIPFYMTQTTPYYAAAEVGDTEVAMTAALASTGRGSSTVPLLYIDPSQALTTPGASNAALLTTPQISWATLRIVGFEADVAKYVLPAAPVAEVCFSGLKIGGGANLFVHENYAPATIYAAGQASFAGLRDYPILESPNTAQVSAQIVGTSTSPVIAFSASLVCEILTDDNYGAHMPGAYARPGALVRQGGGFVNG